ncbi:MAG TPA: hypothetical protein VK179_19595 [Bacteroidales bacterium]|nr:hypothetical protein [Bacteroidales bacterium]
MKIFSKIWQWLTFFFAGIVAGIAVYVKFLDKPENTVTIEKVKNKNAVGNTVDIPIQQQIEEHKERVRKKLRIFNKKNI